MIRKFQKSDTERVMQIWLDSNTHAHSFISKSYWESNFDAVSAELLQAEVYVYESNQEIQGFIGVLDGYIAGIFVDKKYRSRGVGKKLLDSVKLKHGSLSLSVYQKNSRAAAFYLREGFSVQSRQTDPDTNEVEYTMLWKSDVKG